MNKFIEDLVSRYPKLETVVPSLNAFLDMLSSAYRADKTLFVCGNGGSGADADHIVGELLKGFLQKRALPSSKQQEFIAEFGEKGQGLAANLEGALRAISLLSHPGLTSAFGNDVDPQLGFAQQLYGLGRSGDVLIGISTSGNAENIYNAFMVAKVQGIKTMLLTGNKRGRCLELADIAIEVPESETFKIQELHLPIYHTMCMAIEAEFFGDKNE